jgi:hypothetical protein
VAIYGFSFGALWAHETARLIPEFIDSIILGGLPLLKSELGNHTLQDILEHCKQDPFCHSKMGSDALTFFTKMVEKLGDPKTSDCVKLMHSKFNITSSTMEERVKQTAEHLREFGLLQPSKRSKYANVQALLPFVKATIDCANLD